VATALERVPLRVHQDIVLTSQMLLPGDDVILLPAATRYEQEAHAHELAERQAEYAGEERKREGETNETNQHPDHSRLTPPASVGR